MAEALSTGFHRMVHWTRPRPVGVKGRVGQVLSGCLSCREGRLILLGGSGGSCWLQTVIGSGGPLGGSMERVMDRAECATGASCAIWGFGRAIGAASASGAVARVSRNEQVVGSIPTGGSDRSINSNI